MEMYLYGMKSNWAWMSCPTPLNNRPKWRHIRNGNQCTQCVDWNLDLQTGWGSFSLSEHRFNSRQRFSKDKSAGNNKGASAGAKMENGGWSGDTAPETEWVAVLRARIWRRMRRARSRSGRGGTGTPTLCVASRKEIMPDYRDVPWNKHRWFRHLTSKIIQ